MTKILSDLVTKDIDGRYVQQVEPLIIESDVLRKLGFDPIFTVPPKFIHDFESVPALRGSSKRAGAGHDYLSRIDSVPVVTKKVSAAVYREIMAHIYRGRAKNRRQRAWGWCKKWGKWSVVRVWPGYFHLHRVMATYEEIVSVRVCKNGMI